MGNCCALPQPPIRKEAPPPQRYSIVQQPRPTWVGLDVGDEEEDEDEQRQDRSDEEDSDGRRGHESRRLLASERHADDVEQDGGGPVGGPPRGGDRWRNGVKYTGVNGDLTSASGGRRGGAEDGEEECEARQNSKVTGKNRRSGKKNNYYTDYLPSKIQSPRKRDISSEKQDAAVECGGHKLETTHNYRNRVSKTKATAVSEALLRTPNRHSVTSDAKKSRDTAQRGDKDTSSSSADRQERRQHQSSMEAAGNDSVDGPPMRKGSAEVIERSENITDRTVYRNAKLGFEVVAECFSPIGGQEAKTNETYSRLGDGRSPPRELSRSRDETLVKKGYSRLDDESMQSSKQMERSDKAASASTLSECSSGRVSRNIDLADASDQIAFHGNVSLFSASHQNGSGFASDKNCSGASTSRQEASVKPKVKSKCKARRQTTDGITDKNSTRLTGIEGNSRQCKPREKNALVSIPSDCGAGLNASNDQLAGEDLNRSRSSFSGTLKYSISNGGIENRVSTPCDSEPSFLLRNDLEIKESIQRKDLRELVQSFRNNTSLMRKPCKEFLDGQLFQEAQIEHHNTLLSTIRAMNACSLSCVNSRASSMRTVNEQSTIDIGDFANPGETFHGRNARKGLNFDSMAATLPCKKKRSMVSSSPKLSEGPINLGSLKSVELFNLDDFLLEDTIRNFADTDGASSMPRQRRSRKPSNQSFLPSDDCSSTEKASATKDGYRGQRSSLLSEAPSSGRASPRRSGLSVRAPLGVSSEIEVDSSTWLHQDKPEEEGKGSPSQQDSANKSVGKRSVSSPDFADRPLSALHKPTSSFLGGDDDYSYPANSSFPLKNGSHDNDACEGTDAQFMNSSTCRTPSKSKSRYHRGASNSNSSFVDGFATQEDTTSPPQNNRSHSTPKKRTNKYSNFNNSSLNDDNVSGFNADLDVSKRSEESSKYKPMGGSTSAFSNKNEAKMDHFDDDDTEDVSQENGYQDDGDFDPSNTHRKRSVSAFSKRKTNGLGNGSHNSFTGSLDYDNEFPPLGGGGDESSRVNGSSRLNNSPSSGGDDSSTTFDGHFAALNGNSPKFTKKNFKFDEDPRFDSNSSSSSFRRASTSNDLDDSSSVFLRHMSTRSNGTPPSGGHRRSRRDVVNDSQELQPESLFEISNDGDQLVDDAFGNPPNNGHRDAIPLGEEEDEKEGPSLQLNRHVRISKKGVSVGALGCELTIGPRVQLNLFSKKTATLV